VLRLPGLILRGELECSDSLVDEAVALYDDNRVRYIPWARCLRKRDELEGVKKLEMFTKLPDGTLKASSQAALPVADTSSEYLLRNALTRRGLALDQANLVNFNTHEVWAEKLFSARMKPLLDGFRRVSLVQLENADKFMFERLSELTRDGIVPDSAGRRPLDIAFHTAMQEPELMQLLTQMPAGSRAADENTGGRAKVPPKEPNKQGQANKKAKKGAGKGKGVNLPAGLKGETRTRDGANICFAFNLGTCSEQQKNGCAKGKHVCTMCFAPHCYVGNH